MIRHQFRADSILVLDELNMGRYVEVAVQSSEIRRVELFVARQFFAEAAQQRTQGFHLLFGDWLWRVFGDFPVAQHLAEPGGIFQAVG